jgi:protocadherin delta 1
MGPDSQPSDTNVIVHVHDTNDNAPVIIINTLSSAGANRAEIPEDSPVNTFVAHVTVTDPDSGMNGRYNCSLTDHVFRLQPTEYETEYQIFTTGLLDREIMPEYNLALVCLDHGKDPQRAVENIHVQITDVNDNAPEFSRMSYTASIIENSYQGASVLAVTAMDRDAGKNSQLHYTLSQNVQGIFDIDQRTGTITAKSLIDHEEVSQYRFYVLATDSGSPSLSASASVVVMVEDINDEKPLFTDKTYMFSVKENQEPGTLVGTVTATDADGPPYNEFLFSFIHGGIATKTFVIDPKSGRIMLRERLDRETNNIYHLIVAAKDSSSHSQFSSTASVTINVADENDNSPIFDFPTPYNHTVYISNKVPMGYNITRVRAHDFDIGRNGQIGFEIQSGNSDGLFSIDQETGIFYTNVKLNALDYKVTKIQLLAKDHGLPDARFQLADLTVIVNRSIPYLPLGQASTGILSNQNLMIVISVASSCAVIAVILVIAIICIHRRDKLQRTRQYNCRIEAIGRLTTKEVLGQENKEQCHQDLEKKPLEKDFKVSVDNTNT